MGVKQRRERVREATREGILLGARRIARTEGWGGLTMRKLAEQIEYSPSVVYEYFAGKEQILAALMQAGFAQLGEAMAQARDAEGEPYDRLQGLLLAYLDFAEANPELYQVMNGLGGVAIPAESRRQAAEASCDMLEEALLQWAADQGITLPDPVGVTESLWCLLHGFSSQSLEQQLDGDARRNRQLLPKMLDIILAGLIHPLRST